MWRGKRRDQRFTLVAQAGRQAGRHGEQELAQDSHGAGMLKY